ncbi:hypothetical protein [Bradyrhizobium sp. BTAi1]|jgi:hypothetical protein|uniref:hypothetical protein n=1 Tax=Bradyrhizobium sp. (strain BTAi1 / ATCC BAA-1182) TaxID=288000 RepID=UPI00005DD129|nr:hypothetical protein [Bradyrhizobium sp. BTAi1]ABQ37178.1 putative exported protein of unknown function [Bradyrhizobium sp. BTAi1]
MGMSDVSHLSLPAAFAVVMVAGFAGLGMPAAFAACDATLRGELLPDPGSQFRGFRIRPTKLLFFSLDEIREDRGDRGAVTFQSFRVTKARTRFPIPFELTIHSSKDCPQELRLSVAGSDRDGLHYEYPLSGSKQIRLEKQEFERVIVHWPSF